MQKAGILGGGQLGRMLLQQAANYPVETYVLENDPQCPSAHLCHHFVQGNIQDFDDVLRFGKTLDVITIEIETVNIDALEELEKGGVKIIPRPAVVRMIKNKIRQKAFYKEHHIPSPEFLVVNNRQELQDHLSFLPAVQKLGEGGYDGRGVQVLQHAGELDKGFEAPSVLEKMVDIKKEIAVIIGINEQGETAVFPPVEMVFDPELNLLDYQICPANLSASLLQKIESVASGLVKQFESPGLFAVELFVDQRDEVWVNETAPRVHNSGHHTIEANQTSQFDLLWRILLGYPLGKTGLVSCSAMVNLIGQPGYSGAARYSGLPEVMAMEGAYVHVYGKKQTKPGRKMGHVTFLGESPELVSGKAQAAKKMLQVIA
ncbi:MAG: 5-(carboxyamino)imidazole ribonucleotide synthase [Williamsia sp.]|nr:5-(carboxyamino)imidazole ribonucleotide synthase [Williamsia sp.]